MKTIRFAIIGGSGLYKMDGLEDVSEHRITTPFGEPSDAIVSGTLDGVRVAFLARHGRGHSLLPSEIPFRANIWALKQLGVEYLLSVSAVGSLKEHIAPRQMVLPDQFIDMTKRRDGTFFGGGAVAHVSLAQPVCKALSGLVADAFADAAPPDMLLHRGGSYVCIEGPAFSTLAESQLYRSWGASVIGMTNMPEARLAREAEIAYATLALVTDYDCWHQTAETVSVELAIANLLHNAAHAQAVVRASIRRLADAAPASEAHGALRQALITPVTAMSDEVRARLGPIIAKYA